MDQTVFGPMDPKAEKHQNENLCGKPSPDGILLCGLYKEHVDDGRECGDWV